MRHTQLDADRTKAGLGLRRCWSFGSLVLQQLCVALIAVSAYGQPAYLSSPRQLLETDPGAFARWLKTNRPEPVSGHYKARVLASLPTEGEISNFGASSLRKLDSLRPLLRATGRDSAYEIKVIDARQARIGLYARSIVLISEIALTLLGAEELQAQVAHEIGHEYVWADHAQASARQDRRRLKDLELLCDAISIVTLHELGVDPSRLITGVERITRYNLRVHGTAVDHSNYPTLSERREFARGVIARVAGESPRRSAR